MDATAAALRKVEQTRLASYPRMADFAQWVVSAENGLADAPGAVTLWANDRFMQVYTRNRRSVITDALESNIVATAILGLLETRNNGTWTGTATELLTELNKVAPEEARTHKHWPRTAQGMGGAVRRAGPFLRSDGVAVDYDRTPDGKRSRLIYLELKSKSAPGTSAMSATSGNVRPPADAPPDLPPLSLADLADLAPVEASPNGHAPNPAYWETEL